MEHIRETLGSLDREKAIRGLKIMDVEPELTIEQQRERLRRSLGVASLENDFAHFKPVKGTREALAAFKALAFGKSNRPFLLCYGGVGNGKTHLCEATVIELYKRGLFCRLTTMASMMRTLKAGMDRDAEYPYEQILANMCRSERLVIDDVGMGGSGSEWEFGQLEEITVYRYRERLLTIMTTNRDLNELPERIVSRFRDPDVGCIVLNSGADFRGMKDAKRD